MPCCGPSRQLWTISRCRHAEAAPSWPCRALSRYPGLAGGSGLGQDGGMNTLASPHYRHRFPAAIISHAVWLCHVFSLSFRDVVTAQISGGGPWEARRGFVGLG
jgi:hypothetical protein